jgi:hypothetical protein
MVIIKLKYSEKPIRWASRACWWDRVGFSFITTFSLLVGLLFYRLTSNDDTWVIIVLSVAVLLHFLLIALSYVSNSRQALGLLRAMTVPEAKLILEDETFTLVSDAGECVTEWASVETVWCSDMIWFFILSQGKHITLPVAELELESKAFITSKVGAKNVHEYVRSGLGSIDKPTWIRAGFTINALALATVWFYFDPSSSFWLTTYYTLSGALFLYSFLPIIQEARKEAAREKEREGKNGSNA